MWGKNKDTYLMFFFTAVLLIIALCEWGGVSDDLNNLSKPKLLVAMHFL